MGDEYGGFSKGFCVNGQCESQLLSFGFCVRGKGAADLELTLIFSGRPCTPVHEPPCHFLSAPQTMPHGWRHVG